MGPAAVVHGGLFKDPHEDRLILRNKIPCSKSRFIQFASTAPATSLLHEIETPNTC
jgi:hypothetical protein